ncbi:hypothetical protein [Lentibacillus sp.]|nr:hypothetical protein [Lentibacillus sp.]HLS08514.1 hypothetical protein [Lentibacillus sp.]
MIDEPVKTSEIVFRPADKLVKTGESAFRPIDEQLKASEKHTITSDA